MINLSKNLGLIMFFSLLSIGSSIAQDIHFTQFYHSPYNQNPALSGVFAEDQRITLNYRNQWQKVRVPYNTFSGAFDTRVGLSKFEHSQLGLGVLVNYDKQGDSRLSSANLGLVGSITQQIAERHFLSVGGMLGFTQRSFSFNDLTFDNQYQNGLFQEGNPNGENTGAFSDVFFVDASAGVNWHYQVPLKRRRLDVGLSMLHINKPEINFYKDALEKLPRRYNLFVNFTTRIAEDWDILARISSQVQNEYAEDLIAISGKYYLNQGKLNEIGLVFGLSFRANEQASREAWAPHVEVHYQNWLAGLSWDSNISNFREGTEGYGGPELALIYKIIKVKPIEEVKSCPIF